MIRDKSITANITGQPSLAPTRKSILRRSAYKREDFPKRGCLVGAHASPTKARACQNFGDGFGRQGFAHGLLQNLKG